MHEVDKMISIIVPVYNVESFLNICVKSILAQTFKNFELIYGNNAEEKGYKYIYDDYKRNVKIPYQFYDYYYRNNKYMDHFYTEDEKRNFYKRWKDRIKY